MALATFHFGYPITSVTFNGKTITSSPASISYSATARISKITVTSGWSGTVYWDTTSAMSDPYVLATVSNGSVTMKTANLTYTGSNRDVYLSANGSTASYTLTAGSMPSVLSSVYFNDGTSITQSNRSCKFANTKYIRSISLTSSGSTWNGTIYWSSSSGGTTYPIADITNGSISYRSSIESIDFYNASRTIYFTAVQATTYDTNFIYLRTGPGINSYKVTYQNMYGNEVTETISSSTSSTTCAVRSGTNLSVSSPNFVTNYGAPYYIVEYTNSNFNEIKTTFDSSDHNVYSNGIRYITVRGTPNYKYRVHAMAQGGTFSSTSSEDYYYPSSTGWSFPGTTLPEFSLSNIPVPIRVGYKFQGWQKTLNEGSTVYPSTGTVTLTATPEGKVNNLYAVWQVRPHIILDANGGKFDGTLSTKDFYINYGDGLDFSQYKPSWYGEGSYTLIGWAESPTATSPTYGVNEVIGPLYGAGPYKYYAVWQKSRATLTFYGNGGLWNGNLQKQSKTYEVGETVSFATYSNNLVRAGYSLLGWSASSTATTASWDPNGVVTVGATDADYYAVWQKHIDLFYWYGNDTQDAAKIAKGQPVTNLTATIWNEFKSKINQLTIAETGSSWSYSAVSSGDSITAAEVLAARNALAALNNNVPLPTANQLQTGKQILASYFNGTGSLKAALNIIINNYNNS